MAVVPRSTRSVLTMMMLLTLAVVTVMTDQVQSQSDKAAPAKDRVKVLESKAKLCRTADEARILYGIFMTDEETTEEEREKAQPRVEYWTQAAKDDLIRVGTKWMAKSEADVLKAEADKLVEESIQCLALSDLDGADRKLKKASSVYPDHLPSLYLLGIGAALNGKFDGAEKQFTLCLVRSPNNVAVLNNTAVCEVKNRKYSEALAHWEAAANIDPESSEVKRNLATFIAVAAKQTAPKVDRKYIDRATTIFTAMTASKPAEAVFVISSDPKPPPKATSAVPGKPPVKRVPVVASNGYVISKLVKAQGASIVEESQVVGNGSGFVVASGYVLTNRHVVQHAEALTIQSPEDGKLLAAKVLATADPDLALVECKELKASPVAIGSTAPGRGTEVLAFGFPMASVVGKGLKTTRGIITGLPETANNNMFLLDVPVNPGNSGGPLCDQTGRVVGIVTAKTFSDTFVQGYSLAIPINDATKFVQGKIKDWKPTPGTDTKLDWPAVDASLSKSTVMILISKKRN